MATNQEVIVTGKRLFGTVLFLLAFLFASPAFSQEDVYWHIDPSVETCSMVIDPSLTQAQWERYTRQVGTIATFKSLASAEPLGKMNFTIGVDYSRTPVDQRDHAWINTFTHPDADCPLGDQVVVPTLRARLGVSNGVDVGAYWTTAPGANYGMVGGELRYALLRESGTRPAAAITAAYVTLTGVSDYNLSVYSVAALASKRVAVVTPYLGVRQAFAVGTETTDKVDLDRETVPITQGFVGARYAIWHLALTAEYDIAEVNTLVFAVGFH